MDDKILIYYVLIWCRFTLVYSVLIKNDHQIIIWCLSNYYLMFIKSLFDVYKVIIWCLSNHYLMMIEWLLDVYLMFIWCLSDDDWNWEKWPRDWVSLIMNKVRQEDRFWLLSGALSLKFNLYQIIQYFQLIIRVWWFFHYLFDYQRIILIINE